MPAASIPCRTARRRRRSRPGGPGAPATTAAPGFTPPAGLSPFAGPGESPAPAGASAPPAPGAPTTISPPPAGAPTRPLTVAEATAKVYADHRAAVEAAKGEHSVAYKEWQDYRKEGGPLGFNDYMTMDARRKTPVVDPLAGAGAAVDLEKLPKPIRDQAQALVDGRRQLDPRLASKPLGQTIINAAYALDPTFDQGNYNARYKARADLTSPSGTGGKSIGALNTAIQHAGKLSDLIETLDNYETPLANAIVNPIRTATGSTKVTNFKVVAPQLMKEIECVWRGSGGTAGEIHDLIESIGQNQGKQQQREALAAFVDLAKGKLDSLEQQRDNIMGKTAGATIPILFEQNKPIMDTIAQRASGEPATTQKRIVYGMDGKPVK